VHLTLKFLGEISEDGVPDVCSGVAGAVAGIRAFDMAVDGFGAFPSLRRPSVVWTGIELNPSLERVQKSVEEALCELGYPREERRFKPHLTVGRAHKRASPSDFRGFEALVGQLSYRDTYRVSAIDVMQSRLKPTGAVYDVVHSARLEG
jgi:2'-5' RNA ligase